MHLVNSSTLTSLFKVEVPHCRLRFELIQGESPLEPFVKLDSSQQLVINFPKLIQDYKQSSFHFNLTARVHMSAKVATKRVTLTKISYSCSKIKILVNKDPVEMKTNVTKFEVPESEFERNFMSMNERLCPILKYGLLTPSKDKLINVAFEGAVVYDKQAKLIRVDFS